MNVRSRRPSRRRPRISAALAGATAAVLALTGLTACSGSGKGTADGTLDVVASFYPMQYIAEQVGGKHVEVSTLTEPGQEPHDLELSARQTASLQEADALLYLKGLQPAVDDAISQAPGEHKIDAAGLVTSGEPGTEAESGTHGHDEHPTGNEHGGEEHGGEEHGGEEDAGHEGHDHGHDHGGIDPHVWLDPVKYAEIAEGVGAAFAKADPDHAADYRKNAEALTGKLHELDERYRQGLEDTRTKVFITTHAAFGHLAARYGLTQESISGLDPSSTPSAARIRELQKIAAEDHVTTVFYETLVPARTARTLADDTGLRTGVLDPVEGITKKSKGRDYLQVMDANLTALRAALGAK